MALKISKGRSVIYSTGTVGSELTTALTKGYSYSPKWLEASLGISAGKWSTEWNRIQSLLLAAAIFSWNTPVVALYTKNGSSILVNLLVNSIDP
jgi:hypothetical protein